MLFLLTSNSVWVELILITLILWLLGIKYGLKNNLATEPKEIFGNTCILFAILFSLICAGKFIFDGSSMYQLTVETEQAAVTRQLETKLKNLQNKVEQLKKEPPVINREFKVIVEMKQDGVTQTRELDLNGLDLNDGDFRKVNPAINSMVHEMVKGK